MKNKKKGPLLGQVVAKDYDVPGGDCPHSPASTIENIKRYTRIIEKMRKAGITEEEIDFLGDSLQADALHVFKLIAAGDAVESKKKSVN